MEGFREEDSSRPREGGEKTAGEDTTKKETPGVGAGERQCRDGG
jgi:hypothetical protein